MSLKDAFLRTRQAALDIAVERARPKTWKAGRVTQDGVTTVTTDPVAADTPDGTHAELLATHGFDPARYRIVGPIRSTRWTAYLPKEYRTNSVEGEPVEDAFTFQAKASRFQVVERAEGELSIDELVQVVNNYQPGKIEPAAEFTEPGEAYVVALGDAQAGKLESPTEELIGRLLDYMHKAVEPVGEARSDYEIFVGLADRSGGRVGGVQGLDAGQVKTGGVDPDQQQTGKDGDEAHEQQADAAGDEGDDRHRLGLVLTALGEATGSRRRGRGVTDIAPLSAQMRAKASGGGARHAASGTAPSAPPRPPPA